MRRVFIHGGKVGHVTRHVRVGSQKLYNSAEYGHINLKLGGNYRRRGRRMRYAF